MSAPLRIGSGFGLPEPVPYALDDTGIARAVRARVEAFTPEWRPLDGDPGAVLIQLFGQMSLEVADQLRRLPEKTRVEVLRVAGIDALPATPARALVVFDVAPSAPESVLVPAGFQLGARGEGGGEMVILETERLLIAAPGKVAEVGSVRASAFRDLTKQNDDPTISFLPFGLRPRIGDALLLGLDGENAPTGTISIGIGVTRPPGAPRPVSEGGLYPVALAPPVQLAWDVRDGARWVGAELIRDETRQLSRSGVVELRLPEQFRPGRPPQSPKGPPRRWIRVRIVAGAFAEPPALDFLRANAVPASAGRTVADEVLQPAGDGFRFRLSQGPVLEHSLELEVNDGTGFREWQEVESLLDQGPEREVYVLNAAAAEVTFGDGANGRAVPEGVRQVRARSYRVNPTSAAVIKADTIKALLGTVASLSGVTNPRPAGGGDPQEDLSTTVRRGPEHIRARGRAVLPSDYELLALRSPGARVRRAHAMPGRHPAMPTATIAGIVGLLLVPPIEVGTAGPPLPDEETLLNVARHVSSRLAPAGVEIVTGAPKYHSVRVEAQVRLVEGADQGAAVTDLLQTLDGYLHPLTGGDDKAGWPFGGTLRYAALLRRLVSRPNVLAVPRLSLIVDGRRVPPCADRGIGPDDLLWPVGHLVIPVERTP